MFKKAFSIFVALVTIVSSVLMVGCSNNRYGVTGGAVNGIVHEGVYESCGAGTSASSEGKVTTIDGVELKLPVDWGYATRHQANFNGGNWEGDDAARGIGIFNCNEEGDNSQAFADSYAVNIRWEYCTYGHVDGAYPQHTNYKGVDSSGNYELGGVDASCVSGGGIINQNIDNRQAGVTHKAKVIVYNPETGKACVCAPGFNAVEGSSWGNNCNWGGAPLALMGGITTKVSETVGAKQNQSVLELYFADPDTPLGPCEFNGGTVSSGRRSSKCHDSFVDASSTANLAVSAAFDKDNPSFSGHEVVTNHASGSDGHTNAPTTELARKLRSLATNGADDHSADCGYFVSSVVRLTEDSNYPTGYTPTQMNYCDNSSEWETVMSGSLSSIYGRYSELQPGDVFICDHHTFMFVGNEAVKSQFDYADKDVDVVSASQDEYGPQLQRLKNLTGSSSTYYVYRFKGQPHPIEGAKEALGA